jgi:hypothetical protein
MAGHGVGGLQPRRRSPGRPEPYHPDVAPRSQIVTRLGTFKEASNRAAAELADMRQALGQAEARSAELAAEEKTLDRALKKVGFFYG